MLEVTFVLLIKCFDISFSSLFTGIKMVGHCVFLIPRLVNFKIFMKTTLDLRV